ncbi:hypothetical protein GCM10011611_66990 [Aliidongia dinghuensis]|uniref:Uncharacterized protein n=1 Tax=Aliidongia dinghuensis TaxID=1867774 RepID=A0A8J2Z0M1_9PROT|nr:hypothetical protein GCM10011611_66990 [Aliidongia dinghuensis]
MADATVCTFAEVSSEAADTAPACMLVSSAMDDIDCAVASISFAAEDTPLTNSPTFVSKVLMRSSSRRARRTFASF